jgi:hypothetical protein
MKILLSGFINNCIRNQIYLNSSFPHLHPKYVFISFPTQFPTRDLHTSEVPKFIIRNISQLVDSIDAAISDLTQGGTASDADRQELLAAATRLQVATESPLASVTSLVLGVSCDIFLDSVSAPWVTKKLH